MLSTATKVHQRDQRLGTTGSSYVLVTAAYNEEANIRKTIDSMLSQSVPPKRWVIVSDGSFDRTDEIVNEYAKYHSFIHFHRVERQPGRSFGSKVKALRTGNDFLKDVTYEFVGNLDADITLEPTYFEELIRHFQANPKLGLASGFVHEDDGLGFRNRWFNSVRNVPHAAQLVRRECYEEIGGYAVLKYGGEDWYAQTCARMKGWQVESIPQLKVFHHRRTGAGSRPLRNAFRLGRMDYSFGSDPLFEIAKCIRKLKDKPYFLVSLARFLGFAWSALSGEELSVPQEFAAYLRAEQRARFSSLSNSSACDILTGDRNRQVQ